MIYIVLGMHKSGTTLMAKILHDSGINMGDFDEAIGYDEGNKYERYEAFLINLSILNIEYKRPSIDTVRAVKDSRHLSKLLTNYITRITAGYNAKFADWGFKDPRTCLTYQVWNALIPEHKLIVVIRSPIEILEHYNKSDVYPLHRLFTMWKALKAWFIYNTEILHCLRTTNRPYIVIDYSRFLSTDETFQRLSAFTCTSLVDSRNRKMYRNKHESSLLFNLILFLQKYLLNRDARALFKTLRDYTAAVS